MTTSLDEQTAGQHLMRWVKKGSPKPDRLRGMCLRGSFNPDFDATRKASGGGGEHVGDVVRHQIGSAVCIMLLQMDADSRNIHTFTDMFEGFAHAAQRFEAAIKDRDSAQVFAGAFEVLNWSVALDDRVRKHWCPEGKPLDWAWRERVHGAEIMRGVQYVRNSVHHQWSDALERDDSGRRYPKTYPVVYFEWLWRRANELPLPADRREDTEGRAVYEKHLEGEMARETIGELANVFNHLRKLMESASSRKPAPML